MTNFIARESEIQKLQEIAESKDPSITVVYGRRRVGKTTLIEHALSHKRILTIEGLEKQTKRKQIQHVLDQISIAVKEPEIMKLQYKSWKEIFIKISEYLIGSKKKYDIVYFEEVQWLANYKTEFAAELKYVWDQILRKIPGLMVILCGSSPSFMLQKIIRSKALYNRSEHIISVKPFNLSDTYKYFQGKKSFKEVLDAYLFVGGIPEYLRYLKKDSSVQLAIANNSFKSDSFFVNEYEKIFTSSLADNPEYKKIVKILAATPHLFRQEISKKLGKIAGGTLSVWLEDLEICGFISSYTPPDAKSKTFLKKYYIADPYLHFYYKFIEPIKKEIDRGDFAKNPLTCLSPKKLPSYLGYAFERFCIEKSRDIAATLGFNAVEYRAGPYFRRGDKDTSGAQVDLCFLRKDKVATLCEIKYQNFVISKEVIKEMDSKLEVFNSDRDLQSYSVEKVLISVGKVQDGLLGYFNRILKAEDIWST